MVGFDFVLKSCQMTKFPSLLTAILMSFLFEETEVHDAIG